MATARKTPSGMWRIRCLSHTDENKKKHYVSFTEPTKALAEQKAAAFNRKKKLLKRHDLTCSEAITQYILDLPSDISPSTLRGYYAIQKRIEQYPIASVRINAVDDDELQLFINSLHHTASAKTVVNTFSLLMSSISKYTDMKYHVKLPKVHRPPKTSPSDADVRYLIESACPELQKAICLAAFGSLRRGEVSALTYRDVDRDKHTVTIHSDIVRDPDGKWIHKDHPKTDASYRTVELPEEIIDFLGVGQLDDYVVDLKNPSCITDRFETLKKRLEIDIRFHDLRGYCASIMAALGISDTYAQRRGGWSSTDVLKSVYQNVMSDQDKMFTNRLNQHFSDMLKKDDGKDDASILKR